MSSGTVTIIEKQVKRLPYLLLRPTVKVMFFEIFLLTSAEIKSKYRKMLFMNTAHEYNDSIAYVFKTFIWKKTQNMQYGANISVDMYKKNDNWLKITALCTFFLFVGKFLKD